MTDKTTEELNQAEKMAKRYGVRMCDENGDTHGEELYCVGIDDIADIIREALAEPVKQEPVAWVAEDVCEGQYVDGRTRKIWVECKEGVGMAIYAAPVSIQTETLKLLLQERGRIASVIRGLKLRGLK